MFNKINRRRFVASIAASAAGMFVGNHLKGMPVPAAQGEEEEIPPAIKNADRIFARK
ncbi:MAG: hypothetical protein ABIN89_06985 [Chitinophagaceae bacterium]